MNTKVINVPFLLLMLMLPVCLSTQSGCDINLNMLGNGTSEESKEKAAAAGESAGSLVDAAEAATGKQLISESLAETGEAIAETGQKIATGASAGVNTIAPFLPESLQKYATTGNSILGGLSLTMAFLTGLFRSQKKKAQAEAADALAQAETSQSVAEAVIVGVNDLEGAGTAIQQAAKKAGVSQDVETAYLNAVASGVIALNGSSGASSTT